MVTIKNMKCLEKIYIALGVGLCIVIASCSHNYGLNRFSQAVERYDVEVNEKGFALIRSLFCDVYIEQVRYDRWEKLLKIPVFTVPESDTKNYRIPQLLFFHVIVKNTSDEPISIEDAKIKYNNQLLAMMSAEDIKKKYKSPLYSYIDFKRLLSPYRLLGDNYSIEEINYEKDIVESRLTFVPPSDKIIKIFVFDWVPVEIRDFKLIFIVDQSGKKGAVEFDVKKYEYRTEGKHFREAKKKTGGKNK